MKGEDDKFQKWDGLWMDGKRGEILPIAYHICKDKIDLAQRIPRVKELFMQSYVMALHD